MKFSHYLTKIQNSPQHIRQRVFLVVCAVAIALVVWLWSMYIKTLLSPQVVTGNQSQAGESGPNNFSFFQSVRSGLGIVYDSITGK